MSSNHPADGTDPPNHDVTLNENQDNQQQQLQQNLSTPPDQHLSNSNNDPNGSSNIRRHSSEPSSTRRRFNQFSDTISHRTASIKRSVSKRAADFFKVNKDNDEMQQRLWAERRTRMLTRTCGKLKHKVPVGVEHHQSSSSKPESTQPKEHVMWGGGAKRQLPSTPASGDVTDGSEDETQDTSVYHAPEPDEDYDDVDSDDDLGTKEPVSRLMLRGITHLSSSLKKKFMPVVLHRIEPTGEPSVPVVVSDGSPELLDVRSITPEPMDEEFFVKDRIESGGDTTDSYNLRSRMSYPAPFSKPVMSPSVKGTPQTWKVRHHVCSDSEIPVDLIETIVDNSDRRLYGMGIAGQFFERNYRKDLSREEKMAIDHLDDHRPFFTYWVTTVQILVLIISMAAYDLGPWGFTRTEITGTVLVPSLSLQQVDYFEPDNIWYGPRAAALIHLGAKYTPCMRKDYNIYSKIESERFQEKRTACCIRADESGCVQTSREKCSPLLSTWKKWNGDGPKYSFIGSDGQHYVRNRTSGTVCGQDPRYCNDPASISPNEWADDITKWPRCRETKRERLSSEDHMTCEIIGRPCCIGIHGECQITTYEYCDFVKGTFHEKASLCSQVSCMSDVCGMIPFMTTDHPNQFYRLWISLFIHAGILHLIPSVMFQWFFMRDIEKMTGSTRVAIIYFISGVAGNLASAAFVPYRGEVGPAGSQFGLLACLVVEIINSWEFIQNPMGQLMKMLTICLGFFSLGIMLPWVDNYAHISGFLVGLALSLSLLPYITLSDYNRKRKVLQIWFGFGATMILMIILVFLVWGLPIYNCEWCKYLNCIPFTNDWCPDQDIKITRVDRVL